MTDAYETLNDILLDDFRALKIQYEEAQLRAKPKKRQLDTDDIKALKPFHWGYEFDEILGTRGGFDVIITNPPWEMFNRLLKKKFFQQFDPLIQKNKLTITDWKKQRKVELLKTRHPRMRGSLRLSRVSPYVSAVLQGRASIPQSDFAGTGRKQGSR